MIKQNRVKIIIATFCLFVLASCTNRKVEALEPVAQPPVCDTENNLNYNGGTIGQIIDLHCDNPGCHDGTVYGAFDFGDYNTLKLTIDNGTFEDRVFVKKDMPQGSSLTSCELAQLQKWIDNGAIY